MQEQVITNPYELQRQQIIARNRARLLALGIPEAVEGLNKLVAAKKPRPPRPKHTAEPQEPSRQSHRLRDRDMIARGEVPPDVEEGSELAMFIIDGECPRCGKVLSVGHARHLDVCKGHPEPPTEEEIAAQAEIYRAQQKDKLQQLELGGLVDYYTPHATTAAAAAAAGGEQQNAGTIKDEPASVDAGTVHEQQQQQKEEEEEQPQKPKQKGRGTKKASGKGKTAAAAAAGSGGDEPYAIFIVIGSRGDHYTIKLTDERRSCQCLDHRFRRHDCKHIRLILEQLGVSDNPTAWQEALAQKLDALGAADESDVQRVKEAEERAQARRQKAAVKEAAAAAAAAAAEVGGGGDEEGGGGDGEIAAAATAEAAGIAAGRGKARGKRGKAAGGRKRKAGS